MSIVSIVKLYYKKRTLTFQTPDAFISRGDKNTAFIYLVAPYDNQADIRASFGLPSKIDRPTELAILIGTEQSDNTNNEVWNVWKVQINEPTLQSAAKGSTSKLNVDFRVSETETTPSSFNFVGFYSTETQLNSFLETPADNDYAGVGIGLELGETQTFLGIGGEWEAQWNDSPTNTIPKTIDDFELENGILRTINSFTTERATVKISPDIDSVPAEINDQTLLDPIFANLSLLNGQVANINSLLGENGENFMPSDIKQNLDSLVAVKDTTAFPLNDDVIRAIVDDVRTEWINRIGEFPLITDLPLSPTNDDWAFVLEDSSFYGGKDLSWIKLSDVHFVAQQILFSVLKAAFEGKDQGGGFNVANDVDDAFPVPGTPQEYSGYFLGVVNPSTSTLYGFTTTILNEKVTWDVGSNTFVATGTPYSISNAVIEARLIIVENKTINIDEAGTTVGETEFNGNIILGAGGEIIAEDLNFTDDKLIAAVNDLLGFYLDKRLDDNTLEGNLLIKGDLTIEGNFKTINVTEVEIDDNVIVLNAGETGSGVTLGTSGFEIDRGTATNYRLVFNEVTGVLEGGFVGSLEKIIRQSDLTAALENKIEGIILRKDGPIIVIAATDINFVGDGVIVADNGNGQSTITIPGGAGGATQIPTGNVLSENATLEGGATQKVINEDRKINMLRADEANQAGKAVVTDSITNLISASQIPTQLQDLMLYNKEDGGNASLVTEKPIGSGFEYNGTANIVESLFRSYPIQFISNQQITTNDFGKLQGFFKDMTPPAQGSIASQALIANNTPIDLVDPLMEYKATYDVQTASNNPNLLGVDGSNDTELRDTNSSGYIIPVTMQVSNPSNADNFLEVIYKVNNVEVFRVPPITISPNGSPEHISVARNIVANTDTDAVQVYFQGTDNGIATLIIDSHAQAPESKFTDLGESIVTYDIRYELVAKISNVDTVVFEVLFDNITADADGSHPPFRDEIANKLIESIDIISANNDTFRQDIYVSSSKDAQPISHLAGSDIQTSYFTLKQSNPGSQFASDIIDTLDGDVKDQSTINKERYELRSAYELQNVAGSDFFVDAKDTKLTPYRLFTQKYPANVVVNQLARVSYDNEVTYKSIANTDGNDLFGEALVPNKIAYNYYNPGLDKIIHMFFDGDTLNINSTLVQKLNIVDFELSKMSGVGVIKAGWLCGYDNNEILIPIIELIKLTSENSLYALRSALDQVIVGSVINQLLVFQEQVSSSGEWSKNGSGIRREGVDIVTDFKVSGTLQIAGNSGSFPITTQILLFENSIQVAVLPAVTHQQNVTIPVDATFNYNAKTSKTYEVKAIVSSNNTNSIVTLQSGALFEAFDGVARYIIPSSAVESDDTKQDQITTVEYPAIPSGLDEGEVVFVTDEPDEVEVLYDKDTLDLGFPAGVKRNDVLNFDTTPYKEFKVTINNGSVSSVQNKVNGHGGGALGTMQFSGTNTFGYRIIVTAGTFTFDRVTEYLLLSSDTVQNLDGVQRTIDSNLIFCTKIEGVR